MKQFVCNDKNGTPLYVGDEVICLANGDASVGVVHGGDEHNTRLFKVEFPFPEAGFRSFYQHELEKINIMELERLHKIFLLEKWNELNDACFKMRFAVEKEMGNKMIDKKLVDYITITVKKQAEIARYGAGMSGDRTDGGAAEMERHLTFWLHGVYQQIPSQYDNIVDAYEKQQLKENDPDYQLFLTLKEKYSEIGV